MAGNTNTAREQEKADRLQRQLSRLGPLVRGSLVRSRGKCGKPNCRCVRGQLHQWWSLSFRAAGKSRSVTVPSELVGEVRQWCRNYQKLKELVVEVSDAQVALIRAKRAALRTRARQGAVSSSGPERQRDAPSARAGGRPSGRP
jgi:hypothetical protein